MIDPLTMCRLSARAYTDTPTWQAADAYATRSDVNGIVVVALRGTNPRCLSDILADANAAIECHPRLGPCHAGFLKDAMALWAALKPSVASGQRWAITGHSKGAAESAIVAALAVADGAVPMQMTTFGMPCPGGDGLADLLQDMPGLDYRHGLDPVAIPGVLPPWRHPRVMIRLPRVVDGDNPFADHAIAAYEMALTK